MLQNQGRPLQLPIQTSLSVVPKFPVYTHSGENCKTFRKTSTPQINLLDKDQFFIISYLSI